MAPFIRYMIALFDRWAREEEAGGEWAVRFQDVANDWRALLPSYE